MAFPRNILILCVAFFLGSACSKNDESAQIASELAEDLSVEGASPVEFTSAELAEIEREALAEYQAEKTADWAELERFMRVHARAQRLFAMSEARYYERLCMWCTAVLSLASTNVAFSGEVPSRDTYTFEAFAVASEDLLAAIDGYLVAYGDEDTDEIRTVRERRVSVEKDVWLENPSSGSAIADALQAFETEHFAKVSGQLRGGELLARAGAIALGIVPKNMLPGMTGGLDQLRKEWNKVTTPERTDEFSPESADPPLPSNPR